VRRFLGPIALVCAVAWVLLAVVCVKSYFQPDSLSWSWLAEHHVYSSHGAIYHLSQVNRRWRGSGNQGTYYTPTYFQMTPTGWSAESAPLPKWPSWSHEDPPFYFEPPLVRPIAGISYGCFMDLGPPMTSYIRTQSSIPYWLPLAVTGVFPVLWFLRRRRRWRDRPGFCRACGYDLRATPERCPECGAEQARKFQVGAGEVKVQ